MRVGLTFFLRKEDHSVWCNGAIQQCAFLWMLLRRAPGVEIVAINAGDGPPPPPDSMLGRLGIEFRSMPDVVDTLDVLIEAGAQVEAGHVARVRARGGRAVAYKFGNAFVIDAERIIHRKEAGGIHNGSCFDEVWTNPQHERTCRSLWEVSYRCPVRVLPHVWEPAFVDQAVRELEAQGIAFGYRPGSRKKNVAVYEPNHNMVKTCLIPLLACEHAYRRRPDLIGRVYVTNAEKITNHLTFRRLVEALDLGRTRLEDGGTVASFEARYNFPWFQAKHADVVVSHQWENALNFAYYDALYGRYPLIHNSEMLPAGTGYLYHGFDAREAGDALTAALLAHDEPAHRWEYERSAAACIDRVRATAQHNIDAYAAALSSLLPSGPS